MRNLDIIGRGRMWKRPVKVKEKPERIEGIVREIGFGVYKKL